MYNLIPILLISLMTVSCVSHKSLLNYRENFPVDEQNQITNTPKITLQPNDVISIKVYSVDPEAAKPFNLLATSENPSIFNPDLVQLNGYLIDADGAIDFPIIGKIRLQGLTIEEAKKLILTALEPHLVNPVVNIRLLNFKVTVSGEVVRPGTFNIFNERISLPEAISLAGDLTDYADRSSVLVVRELGGERIFHRVNLLSADLFQSEFYYLHQNDLVYIEPVKAKTGAVRDQTSKTIPIVSAAATLIAVLVGILVK